MAKTLKSNVSQAISDFDAIKTALEAKGVDVGERPTADYAGLVDALAVEPEWQITDIGYLFYKSNRRRECFAEICAHIAPEITGGAYAFGSSWLESSDELPVTISCSTDPGTSAGRDFSYMFYNSLSLKRVDFTRLKTYGMTNVESMFSACYSLEFADCSEFDFTHAYNRASLFGGCKRLHTVLNFGKNWSATGLYSSIFPYGSSSAPMALRRLTFHETCTKWNAALNLSYCSFERDGMLEMFNTLPTNSATSTSSKKLTITGNPCVTGSRAVSAGSTDTVFKSSKDLAAFIADNYLSDILCDYVVEGTSYTNPGSDMLEHVTPYIDEYEEPLEGFHWNAGTATFETLTDEDRAIATGKGWTLVE